MKLLDLFSGIGGFHEGFKRAGYEFDWVGYSEIDKYASAVYGYNYKESEELGDIKLIRPRRDLPDNIDILCGGFPCQAFSVAGKRLGFDDTRGTLFFEIARLLTYYVENKRPIRCLVLENVKGLLSHDDGRTFAVIYRILSDLGYTIEFQLLNTRWWLPQNRERIYIVGYIGNRGGPQVFPIGEPGAISDNRNAKVASTLQHPGHSGGNYKGMTMISELNQIGTIGKDSEATRVYDANGISRTLTDGGGMGAKTGLYQVGELKITAKKRSHDTPPEINEYLKANKNGKTIGEIAKSTKLPKTQVEHYFRSDKYRAIPNPKDWMTLKTILQFDNTYDKQVTEIYEKEVEFESSRRVYSTDGISKTLDTHDSGYYQIPEATKKVKKVGNIYPSGGENGNVYDTLGIAPTLKSGTTSNKKHGGIGSSNSPKISILEATKKGYAEAEEGDSINLSVPNSKTRRGRVGKGEAQTLDTGMQQYTIQPVLTPNRAEKRQNGRRFKEDGEDMFTLTQQDQHGVKINTSIRRLTPVECNRLQGFSDNHNKYGEMDGKVVEMSDTQRYKQAGNAVTVDVVQAVATIIKEKELV